MNLKVSGIMLLICAKVSSSLLCSHCRGQLERLDDPEWPKYHVEKLIWFGWSDGSEKDTSGSSPEVQREPVHIAMMAEFPRALKASKTHYTKRYQSLHDVFHWPEARAKLQSGQHLSRVWTSGNLNNQSLQGFHAVIIDHPFTLISAIIPWGIL